MFPTLSEAITGERLTVGAPFFNKWMVPIGLVLLLLTGIGPLLAWRKSTVANLRDQFLWPIVGGAGRGGGVRGARVPRVGLGHLLRAVRLRDRDDRPGVLARRERAPQGAPAPTSSRRSSASSAATSAATAATSSTSASC